MHFNNLFCNFEFNSFVLKNLFCYLVDNFVDNYQSKIYLSNIN